MTITRNMLIGAVIGFLLFMAFVLSGVASAAENTCRVLDIPQLGIHLDCGHDHATDHKGPPERPKPEPEPDCPHGESAARSGE